MIAVMVRLVVRHFERRARTMDEQELRGSLRYAVEARDASRRTQADITKAIAAWEEILKVHGVREHALAAEMAAMVRTESAVALHELVTEERGWSELATKVMAEMERRGLIDSEAS